MKGRDPVRCGPARTAGRGHRRPIPEFAYVKLVGPSLTATWRRPSSIGRLLGLNTIVAMMRLECRYPGGVLRQYAVWRLSLFICSRRQTSKCAQHCQRGRLLVQSRPRWRCSDLVLQHHRQKLMFDSNNGGILILVPKRWVRIGDPFDGAACGRKSGLVAERAIGTGGRGPHTSLLLVMDLQYPTPIPPPALGETPPSL